MPVLAALVLNWPIALRMVVLHMAASYALYAVQVRQALLRKTKTAGSGFVLINHPPKNEGCFVMDGFLQHDFALQKISTKNYLACRPSTIDRCAP
jgi:hypothetical protein